jgi:hypothetical protein
MKNLKPIQATRSPAKRLASACAFLALALLAAVPSQAQLAYPPSRTVDAADTYFGTTYKDPYRWLENLKDPDVVSWFKAQATLTDGQLAKIPARDALAKEWMSLDKLKPARYTDITFESGRVFYKKTLGGENVGKVFYRDGWNGEEKLLFDPGTYKAGVTTTVQSIDPSFDGRYLAVTWSWACPRAGRNGRSCASWTWRRARSCPTASIPPTVPLDGSWTTHPSSTTPGR